MKIILNKNVCKEIWSSELRKVKEPTRSRKIKEFCINLIERNNMIVTRESQMKIHTGVRQFINSKFKETEILIEEDGNHGKS